MSQETFRPKVLEMIALLISPFQAMIDNFQFDGLEDVPTADLPESFQQLLTILKKALFDDRQTYEDAAFAVVSKYLTEEDVDVVLAFNKSVAGIKLREKNAEIQGELLDAIGKWRYKAFEPHADVIKKAMGIEEPLPLVDAASAADVKNDSTIVVDHPASNPDAA